MADRPTPTAPGADTPDEVEITPEMIEAGLGPLLRFSRERDLYEDGVRDIYLAMEAARLRAKRSA
jgi:hypothetical protein